MRASPDLSPDSPLQRIQSVSFVIGQQISLVDTFDRIRRTLFEQIVVEIALLR